MAGEAGERGRGANTAGPPLSGDGGRLGEADVKSSGRYREMRHIITLSAPICKLLCNKLLT